MELAIGNAIRHKGEECRVIKDYNEFYLAVGMQTGEYHRVRAFQSVKGGKVGNDREKTIPNTLRCITGGAN